MKELDQLRQDKTEISAVAPIKTEKKFLGTIKPHRGHALFEINLLTNEIREAEFEKETIDITLVEKKDFSVNRKVIVRDNCVYVSALNKANALKKLNQPETQVQTELKAMRDE